jgi:uncharacterized protein YjiS (DUF1127 family)
MINTVFAYLRNAFHRWITYNRTVYELERLGAHELADLGLRRCDIPFVARGHNRNLAELRASN